MVIHVGMHVDEGVLTNGFVLERRWNDNEKNPQAYYGLAIDFSFVLPTVALPVSVESWLLQIE